MPKFLYPGHNYLGPGNPLENGEPVDEADRIAKIHDYAYSTAKTKSDIYNSDGQAIKDFASDFIKHPNLPAAAGAVGLSLKTGVERLTNSVIYPNLPGMSKRTYKQAFLDRFYRKSKHAAPMDGGPSAEAMDVVDDSAGRVERSVFGGTGEGAASATSGMRGIAPLYKSISVPVHKRTQVYRKQYLLRLANDPLYSQTYTNGTRENGAYTLYPYHDLPVHLLGFYLSPDEIRSLYFNTKSKVKNCKVSISRKTAVTKYATNSSISGVGNNNLGFYLREVDNSITYDRSGYFVGKDLSVQSFDWLIRDVFWGKHMSLMNFDSNWSKAFTGVSAEIVRRNYNMRLAYQSVFAGGVDANGGVPFDTITYIETFFPVNNYVKKRINASMNEGEFTTWEYTPKNGLITQHAFNHSVEQSRINDNHNVLLQKCHTNVQWHTTNLDKPYAINNASGQPMNKAPADNSTIISGRYVPPRPLREEMSRLTIDNPNVKGGSSERIPGLILGLEPEMISLQEVDAPTPVDAHIDIIVTTECTIDIENGVRYKYPAGGHLVVPNNMHAEQALIQTSWNILVIYSIKTCSKKGNLCDGQA